MSIYVYIRKTPHCSKRVQEDNIREYIESQEIETSSISYHTDYESRSREWNNIMRRIMSGDEIICYQPSVLGRDLGEVIENLYEVINMGVKIRCTLYDTYISLTFLRALEQAREVLKDCEAKFIAKQQEIDRGLREEHGDIMIDGKIVKGSMTHKVQDWAWGVKRKDLHILRREKVSTQWIDYKIITDAWTTDKIYREYNILSKMLPSDIWEEKVTKWWINNRRLELTKM